jgi:lysyl-tRNA synthetase class 2
MERHRVFKFVRDFFDTRDFVEVHTPLLVPNPGLEPHLVPFETRFEPQMGGGKAATFYLPTSPEYHLKKALALDLPRIFEITRSFRNGELSERHEPEFFMLEWYRSPGHYRDIADDAAELVAQLGKRWSPAEPWGTRQDITVCEAFKKYCGLDLQGALDGSAPSLNAQARNANFESVRADDDFDTSFQKLMVERIEPKLGFNGPEFLWDYPASQCALARLKPENPVLCERFELYWRGIELANVFGELTDPVEQRRRCIVDQNERLRLYGKTPPLDEEFLSALEKLKGPVGGAAMGLDRLLQCLLGAQTVQEVIAFPHAPSL